MTDITELALLVSKAKASVFTLEYISQFEPADIDSDDVDLRFEVDGRDTGTNVSIVDECEKAAKVIGTLVEALEYYKSREERVTSLVRDNSKSWDELYRQVEAKGKRNVELVEALESEKRICATWRKTAEANSEKLEKAQQRIGKLEKKLTDHKRMNQEMAKAMLTPNDSDAAGIEIAALRQRIAELESRTVTVNLPPKIERNDADGWFMYNCARVGGGAAEWYNKALDDVVAELTAAGIKVEAE